MHACELPQRWCPRLGARVLGRAQKEAKAEARPDKGPQGLSEEARSSIRETLLPSAVQTIRRTLKFRRLLLLFFLLRVSRVLWRPRRALIGGVLKIGRVIQKGQERWYDHKFVRHTLAGLACFPVYMQVMRCYLCPRRKVHALPFVGPLFHTRDDLCPASCAMLKELGRVRVGEHRGDVSPLSCGIGRGREYTHHTFFFLTRGLRYLCALDFELLSRTPIFYRWRASFDLFHRFRGM